jgi:hypothetical protein
MHNLKLPASIEELGAHAFNSCRALTGKLSTPITGGSSCGACRGLTALDLENCKVIEEGCFVHCTGLTQPLKLPSSLQSIEDQAFGDWKTENGKFLTPII